MTFNAETCKGKNVLKLGRASAIYSDNNQIDIKIDECTFAENMNDSEKELLKNTLLYS